MTSFEQATDPDEQADFFERDAGCREYCITIGPISAPKRPLELLGGGAAGSQRAGLCDALAIT